MLGAPEKVAYNFKTLVALKLHHAKTYRNILSLAIVVGLPPLQFVATSIWLVLMLQLVIRLDTWMGLVTVDKNNTIFRVDTFYR